MKKSNSKEPKNFSLNLSEDELLVERLQTILVLTTKHVSNSKPTFKVLEIKI